MDPVGVIHGKVMDKFTVIKKYLEFIESSSIPITHNIFRDDLETLTTNYNLATVDALTKYYRHSDNNTMSTSSETLTDPNDPDVQTLDEYLKGIGDVPSTLDAITQLNTIPIDTSSVTLDQATTEYLAAVQSENYPSMIDDLNNRIVVSLKRYRDTLSAPTKRIFTSRVKNQDLVKTVHPLLTAIDTIIRDMNSSRNSVINLSSLPCKFEYCKSCGDRMQVYPSLSELRCGVCGIVKGLQGTVFEDHQFYTQDGIKTKHGEYVPNRHFKFWMDRIQAKEHHVFPMEMLQAIEYHISRFYPPPYRLTCATMRLILKDTRFTSYNDHIPLLLKTFTGMTPPQLTHNELRVFSLKFNKIIEIYERIIPEGNRPYYPYFIYKIAEEEFRDNPAKRKILDYIHLQAEDTVKKNDLIYEQICLLAPRDAGLVYRETDTTEAQCRF